jgi:hypothetical protein
MLDTPEGVIFQADHGERRGLHRSCKLDGMRFVKIAAMMLGVLFALAGLASVTSGGFLLGVYATQRDPSGFFTSPGQQVGSYGFALTAPDINAILGPRWERWIPGRGNVTVRIEGDSLLPAPLFVGIGPTGRVSKYLTGVPRDKITRIDWVAGSVEYSHVDGTKLPPAPGKQTFWVAKEQGSGTQTLEWELQQGDWTVVIMNADASAPVAATVSVGARFGILTPLVIGLTAGGVVLLAIAATLIFFGARRRRPG